MSGTPEILAANLTSGENSQFPATPQELLTLFVSKLTLNNVASSDTVQFGASSPADTTVLWAETSGSTVLDLKYWNGSAWVPVPIPSDFLTDAGEANAIFYRNASGVLSYMKHGGSRPEVLAFNKNGVPTKLEMEADKILAYDTDGDPYFLDPQALSAVVLAQTQGVPNVTTTADLTTNNTAQFTFSSFVVGAGGGTYAFIVAPLIATNDITAGTISAGDITLYNDATVLDAWPVATAKTGGAGFAWQFMGSNCFMTKQTFGAGVTVIPKVAAAANVFMHQCSLMVLRA